MLLGTQIIRFGRLHEGVGDFMLHREAGIGSGTG